MSKLYLGVDPGRNGGWAIVDEKGKFISCYSFFNRSDKEIVNSFSIDTTNVFGLIEDVHAMPKQGVVSCFSFGTINGLLRGALYANKINFETVTPQKWQKYMNCRTHGDKNISKNKAIQLFPQVKVTHYIADALLIAEYARLTFNDFDIGAIEEDRDIE